MKKGWVTDGVVFVAAAHTLLVRLNGTETVNRKCHWKPFLDESFPVCLLQLLADVSVQELLPLVVTLLPTAREGNVFRSTCQLFFPEGMGAWCHFLSGRLVPCSFGERNVCLQGSSAHPSVLTSSGSHCSSWCASYWNVFLLNYVLILNLVQQVVHWWLKELSYWLKANFPPKKWNFWDGRHDR